MLFFETPKYAFLCFCFMVDCNILVYSYCQIPFIWQLPLPLDFYIFCKCHDMRFTKLSAFTFQLFPDNSHIFSHTLHWMNKTLGNLCRSLVFSCHSLPLSLVSQKLKQRKCPVYPLKTTGPIYVRRLFLDSDSRCSFTGHQRVKWFIRHICLYSVHKWSRFIVTNN